MRLDFITNIKTSMMILVVFYHSCMFYTGHWARVLEVAGDERIILFTRWLNSFHVPAFVMASGYLLYYLMVEKSHYQSAKDFLKRKVKRLLQPYLFVVCLWAGPVNYFLLDNSLWSFFRNYILGISPAQLWFVLMLWWLLAGFYFLLSHKMICFHWREWFGCGLMFAGGALISKFAGNIWQIGSAMQMGIYFYFGCYLRWRNIQPRFGLMTIIVMVALVSGYVFLFTNIEVVSRLSGIMLTLAELYLIYCLGKVTAGAWIFRTTLWQELSRSSYDIFLIHQQIIYFCILLFHPQLNMYQTIVCSFLVTMGLSWLICRTWRIFLNKGA